MAENNEAREHTMNLRRENDSLRREVERLKGENAELRDVVAAPPAVESMIERLAHENGAMKVSLTAHIAGGLEQMQRIAALEDALRDAQSWLAPHCPAAVEDTINAALAGGPDGEG